LKYDLSGCSIDISPYHIPNSTMQKSVSANEDHFLLSLTQLVIKEMERVLLLKNIIFLRQDDGSFLVYNGSEIPEYVFTYKDHVWECIDYEDRTVIFDHSELFTFIDNKEELSKGIEACLRSRCPKRPSTVPKQVSEMTSVFDLNGPEIIRYSAMNNVINFNFGETDAKPRFSMTYENENWIVTKIEKSTKSFKFAHADFLKDTNLRKFYFEIDYAFN